MAEGAALTSAHSHARQAGVETERLSWDRAAKEHRLAAADFSRASRDTSDREALRILALLEIQHQKLASIIHDKTISTQNPAVRSTIAIEETVVSRNEALPKAGNSTNTAIKSTPGSRIRSTIRDSSPSLARDIASRRGIPQSAVSHVSAAAQARTKLSTTTPSPRIPSSIMDSQARLAEQDTTRPIDEDGFTSFYNNLTTGTMSKLSSVLAFAGLPLTTDETEVPVRSKRTVKASTDPDVKKIYSKAALTAIEDDHRQRGLQGQAFGPTESFYVVQTGGGTLSYADIAKAQSQSAIIGGDDEEAFVDAREAQPASPKHSRIPKTQRVGFGNPRTGEELELENATLKQTLEQLASRLANFEAHAQDASMAALTQSIVNLRQPASSDPASHERIKQLEKTIEQQADQREKLEELAKRQEKKIRAYHSKWEEIKKNAREKEKNKREQQGSTADEVMMDIA